MVFRSIFSQFAYLNSSYLRSLVEAYGEIYGIVFLFKWSQQSYPKERELVTREYPENLFFAKQVR